MEVRQLQTFCVLAEELNFTRTAERVHTVQSNVTTQIRKLEEELGVRLFARHPRGVTLTPAANGDYDGFIGLGVPATASPPAD